MSKNRVKHTTKSNIIFISRLMNVELIFENMKKLRNVFSSIILPLI